MATLAEMNVVIGANIAEFEAKMAAVQAGIGKLGDAAKSAGQSLTTYVTLPLGLLATGAVLASAKIDSLRRGLQAVTQQQLGEAGITGLAGVAQAAEDTKARLLELKQVAALPGLGFAEAVQGDIRLRAVGISADLSKRALLAFGNAIATTGGGKGELDRVTVQLGQLSAKGKVLAQDLRPIIEAAPAVAQALKKLYGTVDSETISKSLEKQGQSSTDFINTLTTELGKLPKVTGGLKNSLENLSDSAEINLAKLGDSLNTAFDLEGFAARAGAALDRMGDAFTALDPGTQKLIFGLGAAAAAAGPLLFVIGGIGAAVPAITAGFATLGVTSVAALGPIGLAAAVVAAAAYAIVENWGSVTAYFSSSGAGGQVFGELAASVQASVQTIGRAFAELGAASEGNLGSLVSASGLIKAAFEDVATGITAISNTVNNTVGFISNLLHGEFAKALQDAGRNVESLSLPLRNLLGLVDRTPVGGLKELFAELDKLPRVVEEVNGLQGGDIAGALGITALSEDQQKALDKLQKALRDNENAARALGDNYDYVGNKVSILTSGVQNLTEAGFAPAGRTVQQYAQALNELPTALDRVLGQIGKAAPALNVPLAVPALAVPTPAALPDQLATRALPAYDITAFKQTLTDAEEAHRVFNKNTQELLDNFPVAGFAAIGQAIGQSLGEGSSVLEGAGKALLKVLADFGQKYGAQLLLLGAADIASGIFAAKGVAEIIAGTALIAGSAALGSFAGSGGGSRATGGGVAAPRTNFNPSATAQQQQPIKIELVLAEKGGGLASVLRIDEYRRLRTR